MVNFNNKRNFLNFRKMLKVCGINDSNELGEDSNSKTISRYAAIIPPIDSHLDARSILSLSICQEKSVVVTQGGIIQGVGNNCDGQITRLLPQYIIDNYKQFEIKDGDDHLYTPISAVCGDYYTLFLVSNPENSNQTYLALAHYERKEKIPLFLDTKNLNLVALYGGSKNAAAIDSEGSIILVFTQLINSQPDSMVHITKLPDNEKAVNIACCDKFIVALSSNGRVFESPVSDEIKFTEIAELGNEIINISGLYDHCFAVTKTGKVFGHGSNNSGQLGMSKETKEVDKFTEIYSLNKYKIRAAYAGIISSLFQTYKGKILACGNNDCGQLFLEKANSGGIDSPVETLIKFGALFCIAGSSSAAFINCAPINGPNRKIGDDTEINEEEDDEANTDENKSNEKIPNEQEKDLEKKEDKPAPEEGSSKCCLLI